MKKRNFIREKLGRFQAILGSCSFCYFNNRRKWFRSSKLFFWNHSKPVNIKPKKWRYSVKKLFPRSISVRLLFWWNKEFNFYEIGSGRIFKRETSQRSRDFRCDLNTEKEALHFRASLYLAGFPRTYEDLEKSFSSDQFKPNLVKYVHTIFSTSTAFDAELK